MKIKIAICLAQNKFFEKFWTRNYQQTREKAPKSFFNQKALCLLKGWIRATELFLPKSSTSEIALFQSKKPYKLF